MLMLEELKYEVASQMEKELNGARAKKKTATKRAENGQRMVVRAANGH